MLKPSSLGDVIHALPVLRCLRRHLPASQIHWWIDRGLSPLLAGDPDLNGIVPFDRNGWTSPHRWLQAASSIRRLRTERYDWIIDLQSLARSAIFAWLANGAFTIGLDDRREGAPMFYDLAVPRPSPETHAVDWYLQVLPPLGVPCRWDFDWLPSRPEVQARVQETWAPADRPWLALLPGARWQNKRWPVEHFNGLVQFLTDARPELHFAILGSSADQHLGRAIAASHPARCLDLTGKTSLLEMVEWVRLATAVVSNDTGPMHVAAALRKPVVALFGPTNPRRTGPYGPGHHILQHPLPCLPCMKETCRHARPLECLHALSPALVAHHANQVLG